MTNDNRPAFMLKAEFCRVTGLGEQMVEKMLATGRLAGTKSGDGQTARWLIPSSEVSRLLAEAQGNRVPTMHTAHGTLGGGALTPEAYGGFPAPDSYATPDPDWGDDVDQDGFALNPEPVYQEPSVRLTTSKQRRDEAARRRAAALGDSDAIPVIGGDL